MKYGIDVSNFHCIIHQTSLASKFLSECPSMKAADRIINKIRGGHHSLIHRKFVSYLKSKNINKSDIKQFTEIRWLSRGDCLIKLFDLKEEVLEFLEKENLEGSEIDYFKNEEFILDLAFLADTTSFLNQFLFQLQGKVFLSDSLKALFDFKTFLS